MLDFVVMQMSNGNHEKGFYWGNLTNFGGVTCNRLASCPGGLEIFQAASCYKNRDKLRQRCAIGFKASLHFLHLYLHRWCCFFIQVLIHPKG